jgi:phosphoglycerate dehydrogenase-like enzyme
VVYYDPVVSPEPGPRMICLEELLATSDVVTLHVPLYSETRHLIDASRLATMRPSAIPVNTSRGE